MISKELLDKNEKIKISILELDSITKRIMSLSIDELDILWKETGWIDSEAEESKRKALPNWRLEKIKKDKEFAEESFVNLITDGDYNVLRTAALFLQNLSELENKNGKRIERKK